MCIRDSYKMVPKESKAMLRGEYGKLPGTVNEEVRAKACLLYTSIGLYWLYRLQTWAHSSFPARSASTS